VVGFTIGLRGKYKEKPVKREEIKIIIIIIIILYLKELTYILPRPASTPVNRETYFTSSYQYQSRKDLKKTQIKYERTELYTEGD
jgi:hypothetical protein